MSKKIVIIGGGISGLSAGIFARHYGFDVTILEKNPVLGGLCVGWRRQGFLIDGCVHWLTGTHKSDALYKDWKFLNLIKDDTEFKKFDIWNSYSYNGLNFNIYTDLDKSEKELIEKFPIDKRRIKKFFKLVRRVGKFKLPTEMPTDLMSLPRLLKIAANFLSVWRTLLYSFTISKSDFVSKFKSPALRFALTNVQNCKYNLYSFIYTYNAMSRGNANIPLLGSNQLIKDMADKFKELGGVIKVNSNVTDIEINNKNITSITINDKEKITSDYFISTLDINYLLKVLLKDKYKIRAFEKRLKDKSYIAPSSFLVYLAIEDVMDLPISYIFNCEEFCVDTFKASAIILRNYSYNKKLFSKNNKTVYQVYFEQTNLNYKYWDDLYNNNREEYKKVKNDIANKVIKIIEKQLPKLKGKITLLDVVTPKTFNRYVNAYNGCFMSYTYDTRPLFQHNGRIKNIKNLYLAGQWVFSPGGLPPTMLTGKFAAMRIAKKEKIKI